MSWKWGCSSLQLLLNYQRVLHAIPAHITSWLSHSLTGFNWKRESVHFLASSWSALIIECVDRMWNLAKDTSQIPPPFQICRSVSLTQAVTVFLGRYHAWQDRQCKVRTSMNIVAVAILQIYTVMLTMFATSEVSVVFENNQPLLKWTLTEGICWNTHNRGTTPSMSTPKLHLANLGRAGNCSIVHLEERVWFD